VTGVTEGEGFACEDAGHGEEVPMAMTMRVGAGALVDRFQPDVLEEIRIMAEAAQAPLLQMTDRAPPRLSAFARRLASILAPASV
jgi:hypothetical protein